MPYRIAEIHLELDDSDFEAGLVYYEFGARYHPTPLLKRGKHAFAIVQPLPPLKRVRFHLELQLASGERCRVPSNGDYEMTIGRRGVRQTER